MFRFMLVFGVLLICFLCCSLTNTDAKLLGYWAFDDKNRLGKDSSPNRNDGEAKGFIGKAKWTDKGKVGGGLLLENGQETWLEVPHHESLNVKTGQITLMCWVKFTDPGVFEGFGEDGSLIWKNAPFAENKRFWTSYALRLYRLGIRQGTFSFDANMTEGRGTTVDRSTQRVVNEWYHVAGVADGTRVRIYTNGIEKASADQRGEFRPSDDPLTIGFDLRDPNKPVTRHLLGFVRGIIDEVVILDHALNAGQIKTAMELGEKGKSLENFQPVSGNILGSDSDDTNPLWDAGTYKYALTAHTAGASGVAFSPDGRTLVSGGGDKTVRLWDVSTGEHKRALTGHTDFVNSVAFSSDGRTLASGSWDQTIRLWDAITGEHKHTLTGHTQSIRSVAFSSDGRTLASGSGDKTVRLWDASAGEHKHTLTGHTQSVRSVTFSSDGRTLASGSWDQTIRLWDAITGEHKHTLTGHTDRVLSVAFSSDGRTLASGSWDQTIRLWDAITGEHKHILTGHTDRVLSVAFSSDGHTLASGGGDTTVRLWEAITSEHKHTLTGHTDFVNSVAFSLDGRTLASGGLDGMVLMWELPLSVNTDTAVNITASVSITPSAVPLPAPGEQLTFFLKIMDGRDVAGYQATIQFDSIALNYIESANGDYLPAGAFLVPPVVKHDRVTIAATSIGGVSSGDGTLASFTFRIVNLQPSTLTASVILSDSAGNTIERYTSGKVIEPPQTPEDVNRDGVLNILDLVFVASNFGRTGENNADVNADGVVNIADLVKVAGALNNTGAAPAAQSLPFTMLATTDVKQWLAQSQSLDLTDTTLQRGVIFLEQLLTALTPKETALLPNYPNPFNPETWIPYHLAHDADVGLTIYDTKGVIARRLDLGHQPAGYYTARTKAAYWDGRNGLGEPVGSGVYFYQLSAGDFSATQKMVILK